MMKNNYLKLIEEKIVVFDGAMGTSIQNMDLSPDDYNGLEGCNEILNITKPEVIKKIHCSYFEVGADVVETNSFGAAPHILKEYGIENKSFDINFKAASLAKETAKSFTDRLVAGSIGPGSKLPVLGHIDFITLKESYKLQAKGLLEGGVDVFVIETCQDLLQIKAVLKGIYELFEEKHTNIPIHVSLTIEQNGTMLTGSDIETAVVVINDMPFINAIGINCASGPERLGPFIERLSKLTAKPVSIMPNAGSPVWENGKVKYITEPNDFYKHIERFVKDYKINIIGGCCGTTPEYIKVLSERLGSLSPIKRQSKEFCNGRVASLYYSLNLKQKPAPLVIAERSNVQGSKKFREFLLENNYEGMTSIAVNLDRGGAHMLDLCVAYSGRDEKNDLVEMVKRLGTKIKAPLMFDTTNREALESAIQNYPGRGIINSVSLEHGEKHLKEILSLAINYGAAVVALTIDESGMGMNAEKKYEIAKRIYNIAVKDVGFKPDSILFDPLTFSIASGDTNLKDAAKETLKAVKLIKDNLLDSFTILGISNVSYGLEPFLRKILNSVFLAEAVKCGLDAAIVNPQKIMPLYQIDECLKKKAINLIYNQKEEKDDPLLKFISSMKGIQIKQDNIESANRKPEDVLTQMIINGTSENLHEIIDMTLASYKPDRILSEIMLKAMEKVGELFSSGQMQLPFVLQSAEVMKRGVDFLKPLVKSGQNFIKGGVVLATVKGDIHDVGKNLVKIIWENNGYEVIDLGVKVDVNRIIEAINQYNPVAVGMSGLLVRSTLEMKENLIKFNEFNIKIPVILGGAALSKKFVTDELTSIYPGNILFYACDAFEGLNYLDNIIKAR